MKNSIKIYLKLKKENAALAINSGEEWQTVKKEFLKCNSSLRIGHDKLCTVEYLDVFNCASCFGGGRPCLIFSPEHGEQFAFVGENLLKANNFEILEFKK